MPGLSADAPAWHGMRGAGIPDRWWDRRAAVAVVPHSDDVMSGDGLGDVADVVGVLGMLGVLSMLSRVMAFALVCAVDEQPRV